MWPAGPMLPPPDLDGNTCLTKRNWILDKKKSIINRGITATFETQLQIILRHDTHNAPNKVKKAPFSSYFFFRMKFEKRESLINMK